MATLSLEEIKKKHPNEKPKVFSLADIERQTVTRAQTRGNQFEGEKPTGALGLLQRGADLIFGGGKLAQGAGMGIAASQVQDDLYQAGKAGSDIALQLTKRIREKKGRGEDTSRLENALAQLQEDQEVAGDAQADFTNALPTNKEVLGSATRLAALPAAGVAGGQLAKTLALGKATSFSGGMLRGAAVGAGAGAVEGALYGTGTGLEQNMGTAGVAGAAGAGAIGGAAFGGAGGAVVGGVAGRMRGAGSPDALLDNVTPKPTDLTPTEYKKALASGRVRPKTATEPAQYVLSDTERDTALKYSTIIDKDPVQTTLNINDQIASLDDEVGTFLRQNNGIFSKGELRNTLSAAMDDVTDVTVDEERLVREKTRLIDNFVKSLETNDMESLWIARKDFDQQIEKAFRGSPTLQKEMQRTFRNAVQDYISERTGEGVYKGYMNDMSNLFNLRDTVLKKAAKERSLDKIRQWMKEHPKSTKAVGWGTGLLIANQLFNPLSGGGDSSSGG